MHLSKRKCQPSLLTGYFLSFRTYSKHLNHLNFETENAKIGPHLLTLSKQKTISVQTVPFLQMYLIPCPEVTFNQKKYSKLGGEKQLSGLQVLLGTAEHMSLTFGTHVTVTKLTYHIQHTKNNFF